MSFLRSFSLLVDSDPKLSTALVAVLVAAILAHLIPYLLDPFNQRRIPGPFLARFSDLWLGWTVSQGHRSDVVHQLHQKYGTFVRLAPNHISIAEAGALQIVYAHGNGPLKSNFYDAFVSIARGVFSSRDRADHARKRKVVSPIFSQKTALEFEPIVRLYIGQLLKQWDRMYDEAVKGGSGTEGKEGWHGYNGRLWLDCMPWYNYLAFDIIGDFIFGSSFGMVLNAKDSAPAAVSQEDVMRSYGTEGNPKVVEIPAIQTLNDRGQFTSSMGVLPPSWRPYVRLLPWYRKGDKASRNLAGLAVAAVAKHFAALTDRGVVLSKLQEGRDDKGRPIDTIELTGEALAQLIAGSDTTSNSACAITYFLARYPRVQQKLQKELDEAIGAADDGISTYEQVKRLPYLDAVIKEGMRLHPASAQGLPRVVPEGGLTVDGIHFPQGAILSVPTYTIHRGKKAWGDDADVFRPERWFERDLVTMQKTYNTFSFGPRACVGRNIASMELLITISSILWRYHLVLAEPDKPLGTQEGFLLKVMECHVGIKRRQV